MARKPNYRFERMERERQKQAKKEERKKAKLERGAVPEGEVQPDAPANATADGEEAGED